MTITDLRLRLQNVKGGDRSFTARCPSHDDQRNSLSVSLGDDGKLLLRCHAGCHTEDICGALGISMKDLMPERDKPIRNPVVATYIYTDIDGKTLAKKHRKADKAFSWEQPGGVWKKPDVPLLYNATALRADHIFIVEGEKDVETMRRLGYAAVSPPNGAKSWPSALNPHFQGKTLCIIPDNDKQGWELAEQVAGEMQGIASTVKILDLRAMWKEVPEKGDVSDLAAAKGDAEAKRCLDYAAKRFDVWKPSRAAQETAPALVKASAIPYEPPRWLLPPYFQRGKGTLIQADNGTGKTAFMCAIAAIVSTGSPLLEIDVATPGDVLILSVEDDLPILRGRIEANGGDLDRCHFMTNAAGLTFNSPEVEAAVKQVNAKLLIFDPFQSFLGADIDMNKSNETRPALAKLFEMADRRDCSVAIIAHTSKGSSDKAAVNRSLGSVDIPAAMRSILQIVINPNDESERVAMHVKCSNAPRGRNIAYHVGDRGGVTWRGFSDLTEDDLQAAKKRKERGVPYENEPLVQVFNQLITDKPGGGFWSYSDLKSEGSKILGFPPFDDINDLRSRLNKSILTELQRLDGLIVTAGAKGKGNVRGVKIEPYILPEAYQTPIQG